jgi:hypothetical protein
MITPKVVLLFVVGVSFIVMTLYWVLSGRMLEKVATKADMAKRLVRVALMTVVGLGAIIVAVLAAADNYTANQAAFHTTEEFKFEYAPCIEGDEIIVTYTDDDGSVHAVTTDVAGVDIEVGDTRELTYFVIPTDKSMTGVVSVKITEEDADAAGYPYAK